jgi:hypothetical protein
MTKEKLDSEIRCKDPASKPGHGHDKRCPYYRDVVIKDGKAEVILPTEGARHG